MAWLKERIISTPFQIFFPGKTFTGPVNALVIAGSRVCLIWLVLLLHPEVHAQDVQYRQLCNELQVSKAISDKWSGETYIGGVYSSTPTGKSMFNTLIQRYGQLWGNYQFSPRWKFSSMLAYFQNKDVPELGQYEAPEWRFALQGIYYFHKIRYTLSTRMRTELRFIGTENSSFNNVLRYRQQVKYLKPIKNNLLRKNVFYFLATEEVIFRTQAKESGMKYFDRNYFCAGFGYLITDDLQVEATYSNEFLPRDNGNQTYNAINLTVTFNNLIPNIKSKLFTKPVASD